MVDGTRTRSAWPGILAGMATAALLAVAGAVHAGETGKEAEMTTKPGSTKPGAPPPPKNPPRPTGPKQMVPDPTREPRDDYDVDNGDDEDDRTGPSIVSPKRAAPVRVAPVTIDGIIYRQHSGPVEGIDQSSGLLAAWRPGADRPEWVLPVYPVVYRPTLERDVQEVYFTAMTRDGDRPVLIVTNERGRRFAVDVTVRKVTPLD